jgi:hypothetical protein
MDDRYHVDLSNYSLSAFKDTLRTKDLIPSRVSLKIDLEERFTILEAAGITNMKELAGALKSKKKIEDFSKSTGLSVEYLTLLKRETNSYLPNPVRLDKFPVVSPEIISGLADEGITNTRHLINQAGKRKTREHLSATTGISMESLDELVSLSDLSRAYGVGPMFARLIYDVGIKSISEFIQLSAEEFISIYEEVNQKKADFGVGEIQFSLDLAKDLEIIVDL